MNALMLWCEVMYNKENGTENGTVRFLHRYLPNSLNERLIPVRDELKAILKQLSKIRDMLKDGEKDAVGTLSVAIEKGL